jgi:hypothetical protein
MRNARPPNQAPGRTWLRRSLVKLVAAALAILVVVASFLLTRVGDDDRPSAAIAPSTPDSTTAPSTTIDNREEIVARLQQIFKVRDYAIETRNSSLLESIYTVDCPCRQGDSSLIKRLRRERLVWVGIEVTLQVEEVERINDRLWTVNALVIAAPFRIEKESGELVRRMPLGQELSRFALTRPVGEENWLLGQASVVEGRD